MRRVIRKKLSGYVFGIMLCLLGFSVLFVVFWKAWSSASASADFFSYLWSYILTEQVNLGAVGTLRLTYLSVLGAVFLVLGVYVLVFSRQVLYLSGGSVSLQCPYCRNHWRARRAMGWAECPYCRKFIQPQVMKTGS